MYAGEGEDFTASEQYLRALEALNDPRPIAEPEAYESPFRGGTYEVNDTAILSELPGKREESVRHFRMADGTNTAVVYGYAVHDQDSNGTWQPIDNRLIRSQDPEGKVSYGKKGIQESVRFYEVPEEGHTFRIDREEGSIEWGLCVPLSSFAYIENEPVPGYTKLATDSISGLISYRAEDSGLALNYRLAGHDVKEEVLIEDRESAETSEGRFVFLLTLEGFTVRQADDRTLQILNGEGEEVYRLAAPYAMDAAGIPTMAISFLAEEVLSGDDTPENPGHTPPEVQDSASSETPDPGSPEASDSASPGEPNSTSPETPDSESPEVQDHASPEAQDSALPGAAAPEPS